MRYLLVLLIFFISTPLRAESAQRIVAIGGSVTEIVFALGEQNRLVARDLTSVYPKQAFKLPSVGYIRRLAPEGVLSVKPDLILALQGSGPKQAMDVITDAKVRVVMVPEGYTLEKIEQKILTVGQALGVEDKAKELAAKVRAEFEALTLDKSDNLKKVVYVHSLVGDKVLVAGGDTSAGSIIELSGGVNGFKNLSGFKQVSEEAVISAQPDIILMMQPSGNHKISNDRILNHPALKVTPAGQNKALVRMNGMYLLGFGPRTASAVKDLNAHLYK